MQLKPTVVVGVGQAGISVINRIHDSNGLGWGNEYDEYFDYIAIDSDSYEVRNSPDKATQVHLQSAQTAKTDIGSYPYLTENLDIVEMGARRQRPVGRYKLDSGDSYEVTVEIITETVEEWVEAIQTSSDLPSELNIVHIHSMGGGTGSGTFPLVASIIDNIVTQVQPEYGIDVYTAGIGIVPEVPDDLDTLYPPGDSRYYANTYAAVKDLEQLINASLDDPLPIYRYAEFGESGGGTDFDVDTLGPQRELKQSPYLEYFLFSVDEERMARGDRGPEPYRDAVNNAITAAIYGIAAKWGSQRLYIMSRMGMQRTQKTPIGSFGQTQLSVPIEDIRTYCDLTERIESLREQVGHDGGEGTLVRRLRDAQRQRAVLERIVDNPAAALREHERPDAVDEEIETALDRIVGSEEALAETTPERIERLLNTLTERHGDPVGLVALDRAEERLIAAKQRCEADLRELVDDYWQQVRGAEVPDTEANTVSDRAEALQEYLRREVERLERKIDESEPWFLPDLDIIGLGPDHEQQRDAYQQRLAALEEGQATFEAVRETLQAVRSLRAELLKNRIEPELDRLEERINERRDALEQAMAELDELIEEREETVDMLTDAEYGNRLSQLALNEKKLREDLDQETLEEDLTSLSAFDENGYLARDLGEQIEHRTGKCYAWDSTLVSWRDRSYAGFGTQGGIREVWMLHSDENASLPGVVRDGVGQYRFRRSGDGGVFPSFEDPYTVQFLSYTLDSPLTDLRLYAGLEEAVKSGRFDTILDLWDDYRLAIAYPEWYGREIYRGFGEHPIDLPELPELDETKVTVEKEGGELKAWISSHGLASYLWSGDEWDAYDAEVTVEGYDRAGWKHYLGEEYDLTYDDMRAVVPNGRTAALWHAGELTWGDLLEEVQENLLEKHGIEVTLTSE